MAGGSGFKDTPSIEKLVGHENYRPWLIAVEAYLQHEDLWGTVVAAVSVQLLFDWTELTEGRIEDCASVDHYPDIVVTTSHRLKITGLAVTDNWLALALLSGFSKRYKLMVMSMEGSTTAMTSDQVESKILQEVKFQSRISRADEDAQGLFS
ncbi:hypothetical protein QAD02_016132 [Eretmocerus hayati]|uniref:Uncharacterized protein n=2 Tax=Eretmocerus hayati TaxID=131215 RepID=A0ACC2PA76_9HYME|nr:hypothetical protein QAD02_016129 [Eretmocerus hayati]KAJ8680345.1 hypothetical protein QAD02_016132 [Eretmocerus hayati]